jgi:hypothetical protein
MLRRAGLRVHTGPIVSVPRIVVGAERARLAATGALAVDMESAWLARGCADRPWAVVRTILDTPDRDLHRPLATATGALRAYRALAQVAAALSQWSEATGERRVVVVGSSNSSNSMRLVEVAERSGCRARLVDGIGDVDPSWLAGARTVGVTAGASAPERIVQDLVTSLRSLGPLEVLETGGISENVHFGLPAELKGSTTNGRSTQAEL